jgi:hypothetical protein
VGKKPVYREMQDELTEMVGKPIYEKFVTLVREQERLQAKGVPLPHPAVRTRAGKSGSRAGAPVGAASGSAGA